MRFFLIFFFISNLVFAQDLKVIDGDTIHIGKVKYRFHGIDAPEMSQICKIQNKNIKCGLLSKKKLLQKINNNKVDCKKKAVDRYKRIVAECFVNNQSLSSYLVKNGYAFAYKKYSKQFVEDEMFAKKNRLGLWAMEFQYPWDYRRNK
ncbi:MAG: thermonuclease family protein [Pelagibacteraceae bacterium]|jgi:endonuclease YncB( thermonuclease family)